MVTRCTQSKARWSEAVRRKASHGRRISKRSEPARAHHSAVECITVTHALRDLLTNAQVWTCAADRYDGSLNAINSPL